MATPRDDAGKRDDAQASARSIADQIQNMLDEYGEDMPAPTERSIPLSAAEPQASSKAARKPADESVEISEQEMNELLGVDEALSVEASTELEGSYDDVQDVLRRDTVQPASIDDTDLHEDIDQAIQQLCEETGMARAAEAKAELKKPKPEPAAKAAMEPEVTPDQLQQDSDELDLELDGSFSSVESVLAQPETPVMIGKTMQPVDESGEIEKESLPEVQEVAEREESSESEAAEVLADAESVAAELDAVQQQSDAAVEDVDVEAGGGTSVVDVDSPSDSVESDEPAETLPKSEAKAAPAAPAPTPQPVAIAAKESAVKPETPADESKPAVTGPPRFWNLVTHVGDIGYALLDTISRPIQSLDHWTQDIIGLSGIMLFAGGAVMMTMALLGPMVAMIVAGLTAVIIGGAYFLLFLRPQQPPAEPESK